MTNSVTLICTPQKIAKMKQYYSDRFLNPIPYSEFRAKTNKVTITAYRSGKVLFQGNGADIEASKWEARGFSQSQAKEKSKTTPNLPNDFANWTIIGSDEVGNGSYFGPLVVCALYLPKEKQSLAKELGARDSKKLTDTQIRDIAWQLEASFKHATIICNPAEYNQLIGQYNAVSLKVHLHNRALNQLIDLLSSTESNHLQGILIDQFTSTSNYQKYLKTEKNPVTKSLYTVQKGESAHLAVACASIIARKTFIEGLVSLGADYGFTLPSGAGANVDTFGARLMKRYGKQALYHTAKLHFKNTEKIEHIVRG